MHSRATAFAVSLDAVVANSCTSLISGPNDPDYAPAERNPAGAMTFNAEQWHLYDCIPQSAPVATDPENASGMSVNKAWAAYGMGRSDVLVAYIEGGVNWRLTASKDIRRKAYLNCGELPAPENAAFTAEDRMRGAKFHPCRTAPRCARAR